VIGKLADHSPRQLYHHVRRRLLRQERAQSFDERHPCAFVLSTGRAGTKTLAALLGLVDNVFAYHEPQPKLFALSRLAYRYGQDEAASQVLWQAFLTARQQNLHYALSCGRGYVETSPQVTFLAPAILATVPGVRFIHLTRHPADVVFSGVQRGWYAGHPYDSMRITPLPDSSHGRQWQTYSVVQKNLWLWAETNRWILEFSAHLPAEQRLHIRAEDMFAARTETIQRLFAFIGSRPPRPGKVRAILTKKLNAQRKGLPPLSPADQADIEENLPAFTTPIAAKLGYVPDDG